YSLPTCRSCCQVRLANSSRRHHDHRKTFARAVATVTPDHLVSRWFKKESSSSLSKWRTGRFLSSTAQVNCFQGFSVSSLLASTTPRTHLTEFRVVRSKAARSSRDHFRTVFGERQATSPLLLGCFCRQFLGRFNASRWKRAQSSGVAWLM